MKLPTINVGMIGGGSVVNAIPREAWFTVDLRSLDSSTQDRLHTAVVATAKRIGEEQGVGFKMERQLGIDYSNARPQAERLSHPLVQTTAAVVNHFRKNGTPEIRPKDAGSNDSNIAVSMGMPAVAIGAVASRMPHRLEESAEASSIVPGIKSLIALAVALTTH
jgi:acetylornithine deacetylase/succinyl-diaminopimelate desuccinylase-like protein